MRLHRLRVTAFQAFAGSEEVDFDTLGEAGLFLLHGDTGAGKTTLLDAVCFALYGKVPGAREAAARLRSDHAAPEVRTEVELELTLRDRRLRVVRRPRQTRPKLRGEGMTEEAPSCTVEALGDDGAWSVLAARRDEADAELLDLLGMTCDQFCQVALLPQGEFATFLRADSGERQGVLERLFGTDRFTRVEHWLIERRKAARAQLDAQSGIVRDLVSRVAQAADEESPEELELVAEWVAGLGVRADAELVSATAARDAAGAARTAAEGALAAGRELAERRSRHAVAVIELASWQERHPARDAAEAELGAARRAEPLAGLLADAGAGQDRSPLAVAILHCSPPELRARATEARGEAGALDALVAVEARLAAADEELTRLAASADEAASLAWAASGALEAAAQQRAALDAALAEARRAAARVEGLEVEATTARARAEQAAERDRHSAALTHAQERLQSATATEQASRAAWLDLREQRLDGMAAELAGTLVPGEPCAVCGATEHPAPAAEPDRHDAGAAAAAPDAAAPAAPLAEPHPHATSASSSLAEREQAAEQAHAEAAEARDAARSSLAAVEAAHAAAHAVAGDEPAEALAAAAAQIVATLEEAKRRAVTADATEQALATLAVETTVHEQAREQATQAQATARATHAERSASLAADRERVAAARGDAASVAERAAALRAEADAAEQEAAAREAGFADAGAARAALRDEAGIETLQQQLRAYDAGLAERAARIQEPELLAAVAAPERDLPTLEAAAAAAVAADEAATGRHRLAERQLADVTRLTGEIETGLADLAPVAERERRLRELAALVDGSSAANRLHMKLSAYVLAARLEEVAAAATVRLERMSDGRYQLVHTDERARRERRAGLELRIVDGWTGQERAPGTLSGGETFLASLALALGLADVVAAEAGGSRLETLFVDEGFGTLDEKTLDEVLDVLDGLREGGRVVGIVSHVAELRQRIPAQVHVVKGRDGSHVEQRVGAAL